MDLILREKTRGDEDEMKSILRIVNRYVGSAFFIAFLLLSINLLVFGYCITLSRDSGYISLNSITSGFYQENGQVMLKDDKLALLDEHFTFAMMLGEDGEIIWSHSLPEELNRTYSLKDIASMSKWYLDDYPVWTWNCEQGLLILGNAKDSIWKLSIDYPLLGINRAIIALPICNLILLSILCLFFGWRFYRSLKPVAEGIESLSMAEKTQLKENGLLCDLKRKINQTSEILEKQKLLLSKRDDARTQWIAGVSHDIRTPLSMIMGYADTLSHEQNLTPEQNEKLEIIKKQSITIKELIEDLNMTSKLEYQMQPLHVETIHLPGLLRQVVADYYNQNLTDSFSIELAVEDSAESLTLQADSGLLTRAFRNLIGNSIRHNEEGCNIWIHVSSSSNLCTIEYSDNGKGIPNEVLQAFIHHKNSQTHIMGLYLIEKIIQSHHGEFHLAEEAVTGMSATIILPVH